MWPVDPRLKSALVNLRRVKSEKPNSGTDSIAYADWREDIGRALLFLAEVIPSNEEKVRVRSEAEAAFAESNGIRQSIDPAED